MAVVIPSNIAKTQDSNTGGLHSAMLTPCRKKRGVLHWCADNENVVEGRVTTHNIGIWLTLLMTSSGSNNNQK